MEEMRSVVQANDLAAKVIFFGMLPPEELKKRTAQAYVAVNPFERTGLNQYLSLSNKFFDYIHAGIPQVTMNYPEYKKINDQFKIAELIDDLDPENIAKAIHKLITNKELYLQLKQNCLAAKQELNWQKEKDKLLDFTRNCSMNNNKTLHIICHDVPWPAIMEAWWIFFIRSKHCTKKVLRSSFIVLNMEEVSKKN